MKLNPKTHQLWLALTIGLLMTGAAYGAPQTDGTSITWSASKSMSHAELSIAGPDGFQLSESRDAGQLTLGLSDAEGKPLADGIYEYTLVTYRGSDAARLEMEDFAAGKFLVENGRFVIPGLAATQLAGAGPVMEVHGSVSISGSDGATSLDVEETSGTEATRALATLSNNGGLGVILSDTSLDGLDWSFLNTSSGNFIWSAIGSGVTEMMLEPTTGDLTIGGSLLANNGSNVFPDYVFEDDYDLLSLDQLETFIDDNGHLPNIPSGKQVEEKGVVNVTELQRLMLEKIEELTLYTLQQHRTIEALEKRLAMLEDE